MWGRVYHTNQSNKGTRICGMLQLVCFLFQHSLKLHYIKRYINYIAVKSIAHSTSILFANVKRSFCHNQTAINMFRLSNQTASDQ